MAARRRRETSSEKRVQCQVLLNAGEILRAHARLRPEATGARDLERTLTYAQWNARACRLANALLGLGLAKGARVAVLSYNRLEWAEIYAAVAKAGLVAVPINFRLTAAEADYIIKDCEAAARPSGGCPPGHGRDHPG